MTALRPVPIFVADAVALDFLNSIATPVDTAVEWLTSGDDLLAWLEASGLTSPSVARAFRVNAVPGELDVVAAQARVLREWFREFVTTHMGAALRPEALAELEPLNRLLGRDEQFGEIESAKDHFRLVMQRRWRSPDALLLPIAYAIADLICGEDFAQIKACEGETCTLLFADHTRGHARRWCSMAVCGNRAKQAAHRGRALRHDASSAS
jgi:predicted RNA-binding Zn ribbon-like protein